MKKNISFITIDTELLKWIYKELSNSNIGGKEEFLEGIKEIIDEKSEMAMLIPKRENNAAGNTIHIGELTIIPTSRKVLKRGKDISLTPKEFDILYFLAKNRGEVFTKERIYQEVWEDDYLLDDSNIMAFIRKLRKKIEENPDQPEYIITVWGIGYMFSDSI